MPVRSIRCHSNFRFHIYSIARIVGHTPALGLLVAEGFVWTQQGSSAFYNCLHIAYCSITIPFQCSLEIRGSLSKTPRMVLPFATFDPWTGCGCFFGALHFPSTSTSSHSLWSPYGRCFRPLDFFFFASWEFGRISLIILFRPGPWRIWPANFLFLGVFFSPPDFYALAPMQIYRTGNCFPVVALQGLQTVMAHDCSHIGIPVTVGCQPVGTGIFNLNWLNKLNDELTLTKLLKK